MAGSLAEQKIAGGRISPVRAAVDGAFNAAGGKLYGTSPLRNAKDAFMRGALEGALKGGAYNIADVLDNKLRNAYDSGSRRNPGTSGTRNPWNKKNQTPWNSRNPRPTGSKCPQSDCIRPKPLKGICNPKRESSNGKGNTAHRNDRFSLENFVRDVVSGAVMGGLASVAFFRAGKAVEALKRGVQRRHIPEQNKRIIYEKKPQLEYNLQFFAKEKSEDIIYTRVRHYTNSKGLNGIRQSGIIYAQDNNRVYLELAKRKPMSIVDAEEFYELKKGKGRNYVEFDVNSSKLEWIENPRYHRLELTVKGDVMIEKPKFFKRPK